MERGKEWETDSGNRIEAKYNSDTDHAEGVPDHESNAGICDREEQRRTGVYKCGWLGANFVE